MFAYSQGLSLHIKPGQVVALVGPSGGGKSTIVSLIERFYDCNSGTISISTYNNTVNTVIDAWGEGHLLGYISGGLDVKQLDPLWFRTRLSLVSQEPTLFACSIRDNIAYGTDASLDQVNYFSRLGHLVAAISSLPSRRCHLVAALHVHQDHVHLLSAHR